MKPGTITKHGKVLAFICFMTVFSQLPVIINAGYSSAVLTGLWICWFLYCIISNRGQIIRRSMFSAIIIGVLFFTYAVFMALATGEGYITSKLLRYFLLSIFVRWCGTLTGLNINKKDIQLCCYVFVIAVLLVSINIYLGYFKGQSIFGATYLYGSKNSIAVIIVTAVCIILCTGYKKQALTFKILLTLICGFMIFLILILKCRAVIITLPIITAILLLLPLKTTKAKAPLIILCFALVVIIISNETLMSTFIYDILYAGRGQTLIDSSSGRVDEWKYFFEDMQGNWLFGNGSSKRESMILTAFMQFGFFWGIILILYSLYPILWSLKHKARENNYILLLLLVSTICSVNSIFEQLSPYGPGVRCFFLWLLLGILSENKTITSQDELNKGG